MTAAILPPSSEPLFPDATRTLGRALSAISKGYHVFPVRVVVDPATGANTKTYVTGRKDSPVGANWNATQDEALVRTWWGPGGRFNDCMMGVSTEPSTAVLIDLDVKAHRDPETGEMVPQDGPGEWARLVPEPYPLPAAIGYSSTGGIHLPYRADPKRPVRTTQGELAPGIDTRGIGGMFVCWADWLPAVKDLPPVPDVLCERLPYVTSAPRERIIIDSPATLSDDAAARVLYHAGVIAAAADGVGTSTASRQAFLAGQYVGAGQVDAEWARKTLLAALDGWTWRRDGDRRKLEFQVTKGLDDGAREPRAWIDEPQLATVTVLRPATCTQAAAPAVPPQRQPAPSPFTPPAASGPTAPIAGPATPAPHEDSTDDGTDPGGGVEPRSDGHEVPVARQVVLTPLSAIPIRRARWLWDGRIPLGALSLVAGKQGLGKSTVVYDLVTRLTRGELEGEFFGTPRAVLICATEDSWSETIKPRLVAAGVDESLVYRVEAKVADFDANLVLPEDVLAVEQAALQVNAALLVLDPLTSRLSTGLDMHKDSETRRALEPLVAMAGRCRMAVGGLMHLNKSGKADPMDAVMGATAFTAVARSVLIVMPDPDDEEKRRKFIGLAKNNLGRLDLPMLAFRTVSAMVPTDEADDDRPAEVGRIEWLGEADGSIGDAMERAAQDPETRTAIGDAAAWLRDYLTACGGSAESAAVRDAGRSEGHNAKTLSRALKKIGGRSESLKVVPRRTNWTLPIKSPKPLQITTPDSSADHTPQTQNLVSTVLSVSTGWDSGASGPQIRERGPSVRTGDATDSTDHPTTPAAPPWMADELSADVTQSDAKPVQPPCPCGRPEGLHRPGNMVTCKAGHRWHAFGHGALDACPQCPPVADDAPDGAA